uniref:Na(+)/H(+) exchange regulatory cofactor NHE-RF1 n=1 Tax=Anas platyrhynchos TaxID=8839 RepID=A0A8B9ZEB3_ANAPL
MAPGRPPQPPRPRGRGKGPDGYGFHLHGEKGKPGQFIRLVEAGSPAERSGLLAGDRLLEVDGANVERESHQQVVERIRAAAGSVRLLVVQPQQPEEVPAGSWVGWDVGACHQPKLLPPPPATGDWVGGSPSYSCPLAVPSQELRPRLCHIKKGPNGYGFNLHSDKSRPGQYIRSGAVNGVSVEGKQHASVVAAIKEGGDDTKLLVVDVLTDEFFKKCKVVPSEAHLAGGSGHPLTPQPGVPEGDKRSSASGSLLDLDIPLAVAKERAHQKRTSKRAPQMDWSKKNELFSNL